MKVLDIQEVTFDNVCLYFVTANFDCVELFTGNSADIPRELLYKRVSFISVYGTRGDMLDIRIEM